MSARHELIAAALTAADLMEGMIGESYRPVGAALREACARAMVQPAAPDMEEVERLLYAHESAVRAHAAGVGEGIAALATTRTALLDTVRGVLAERDTLIADNERLMQIAAQESDVGTRVLREVFALCEDTQDKCSEDTNDFTRGRRFEAKGIARAIGTWYQDKFCGRTHLGEPALTPDHFRDAAKMVPGTNDPDPLHLSRILHELAGAASMCWIPRPSTTEFDSQQAIMFVEQAITEIRQRLRMVSAAPQPVDAAEVPMPDSVGLRFDGTSLHKEIDVRTYGEQCRAAGYAAGVAAGGELTAAARSVLDERQRQIGQEGWTPEHDDAHDEGELAVTAACYVRHTYKGFVGVPGEWCWDASWWKPRGRRHNLVKAGALILAEIERLDRAALRGEVKP